MSGAYIDVDKLGSTRARVVGAPLSNAAFEVLKRFESMFGGKTASTMPVTIYQDDEGVGRTEGFDQYLTRLGEDSQVSREAIYNSFFSKSGSIGAELTSFYIANRHLLNNPEAKGGTIRLARYTEPNKDALVLAHELGHLLIDSEVDSLYDPAGRDTRRMRGIKFAFRRYMNYVNKNQLARRPNDFGWERYSMHEWLADRVAYYIATNRTSKDGAARAVMTIGDDVKAWAKAVQDLETRLSGQEAPANLVIQGYIDSIRNREALK